MKNNEQYSGAFSSFSRRGFLKGAAVVAAASKSQPLAAATGQIVAYVGAYTDTTARSKANGDAGAALYIYDLNPVDGTLTRRAALKDYPSPSSLALDPKNKFLYAVNEISNFNGTPIEQGNFIWFNANFTASGIPSTGATISFTASTITFTADQLYTVNVPNAQITFIPGACAATQRSVSSTAASGRYMVTPSQMKNVLRLES